MEERHEIIHFKNDIPVKIFLHRLGDVARHWHQSLELLMIVSGKVVLLQDDRTFELEKDDLVLIGSNSIHELHSDDCVLVAVQLKLSKFDATEVKLDDCYFECNSKLDLRPGRFTGIKRIVANMIKDNANTDSVSEFKNKAYAYALLDELISNFRIDKENGVVNTQKHLQRLSQILNYINTNYRQRLTLTEVAKHEHLSVPYLSSFFERYMGRNFLQYYTDLRLDRAVNELLSSDESIEEISYNNGFSNPRSFVQAFKKKYSVLPSVYRKQEQQITPAPSHDNQDLINYLELDQRSYLGTLASYIAGEEAPAAPVTKPGNFLKVKPVSIEKNEKTLTHYYKNFICVGKAKDLLTAEIQTLLKRAQREIGFKFIKFHGIFSDDMLVVQRDAKGILQYSFVLIDKVLDFLLSVGLKPLLQFSFMPEALASDQDKTLFAARVNTSPPKDFGEWRTLVNRFMDHITGRYGLPEMKTWLFSVWNEPDTSPTMFGFLNDEDYYRLYQETYLAVKETSTALAFGSPSLIPVVAAGEVWLESFIAFARKEKILPDFINLHYYSDLFGDRSSYDSQNAFVALSKLSTDEDYFSKYLSKVTALLSDIGLGALPVYITEWNLTASHRSLINDTCFKSCYYMKNVLENYDRIKSLGYWVLSDSIEEVQPSEGQFHGGLGLFTQDAIAKPTYHAMKFLALLGDTLIASGSSYFITRRTDGALAIICYNYEHFDDLFASGELFDMTPLHRYTPFQNAASLEITIPLMGIPHETAHVREYYVNRNHGSVFDTWADCGGVDLINREDKALLEQMSAPGMYHYKQSAADGTLTYSCVLEPLEVRIALISF